MSALLDLIAENKLIATIVAALVAAGGYCATVGVELSFRTTPTATERGIDMEGGEYLEAIPLSDEYVP